MGRRADARSWKPRETIDVRKKRDLRYWSEQLRVSREELVVIVEEVGDRAATVATVAGVALPRTRPDP
jgi:hypothetical protein